MLGPPDYDSGAAAGGSEGDGSDAAIEGQQTKAIDSGGGGSETAVDGGEAGTDRSDGIGAGAVAGGSDHCTGWA